MFIYKQQRKLSIFLSLLFALPGTPLLKAQTIKPLSSSNVQSDTLKATVDKTVAPFMANSCHVGLSIAVIRGNETRFYNYGSISRDAQELPGADSVYEIASVTKTFTGALAAKAIVDHRMELDADFRSYLRQPYPNLEWQGHPITLRSLSTHRSGLQRDLPDTDDLYAHRDFEKQPAQLLARDAGYDHARYLRELHMVRLRSEPGTEEAYSNLGLKVIGFGLETVYGVPFETLLQREILGPLGMTSTGFVLSGAERSRLVKGYSRGGNLMPYHLRNAGAAYGLYSTPRDMAKYVLWQLDESKPAVRVAHELIEGNATDGKALIWNVTSEHGSRLLWHGGGTFGMTSQVVLYPDHHEGYVLLANDTCAGTEDALKDIAVAVHEGLAPQSK